jgi:hypothetical protein
MSACNCNIHIEVDNKRALATLTQAWAAFEALWPKIEEAAKAADAAWDKRIADENQKADAEIEECRKRRDAREAQYQAELAAWEARWFAKGPRPERPYSSDDYILSYRYELFNRPRSPLYAYATAASFRNQLKRQLDIASIANAPYPVPEEVAQQLCDWESGDRIEYVHKRFVDRDPSSQPYRFS